MIPRTYPSQVNSTTGRVEMKVSFINDPSGLTRWIDYIPVSYVTDSTPKEGSYDNDGYIAVVDVGSTSGLQAGKDYVRVVLEQGSTDAWQVSSVGFIPVGYSGFGSIPTLFANSEPGVWYDPSDMSTLFQDAAGTTPVTAVEQPVGLMLDKSKGLVLGPELVTTPNINGVPIGGPATTTYSTGGAVVVGKAYQLSFTISDYSGTGDVGFGNSSFGSSARATANGTYSFIVAAVGATPTVFTRSTNTCNFTNISVKELPGNHATQSTSTSRPVLSARYNLLTKTEQFNDAAWTKTRISVSANAVIAPDGTVTADKLVEDTTASASHFTTSSAASFTAGATYTLSAYAKAGERSQFGFNMQSTVAGVDAALFNLATGSVIQNGSFSSTSITPVGNGWYRCTGTITATGTASAGVIVRLALDGATSYTGDGTSGIFIWGASLVPTNQSSLPYQRVDTSTVYDSDATKFPAYLKFDGVDDWMVTPTITPGTDKVQVFAGVRKLSDAASGMLAELSADLSVNNGSFAMVSPSAAGANSYRFTSKGSLTASDAGTGVFAVAPITNVLSGIGNISADQAILRVNGTQTASSTTDQGTGNYLAYPLYIGRRGGVALPFNGQLYSLITRFGPNLPTATIEAAEKYVAVKTGITI